MGAVQATDRAAGPTQVVGAAPRPVRESGEMWVLDGAADGGEMDLLEAMGRACALWWPAARTSTERIVTAIRPLVDSVRVLPGGQRLRWQRASGHTGLWNVIAPDGGATASLTHLETLAYGILAADPVDLRLYQRWARGVTVPGTAIAAANLQPRGDLPANVQRILDPWMACYRRSNRPVGPYWLFPLLYLLFASELRWGDDQGRARRIALHTPSVCVRNASSTVPCVRGPPS